MLFTVNFARINDKIIYHFTDFVNYLVINSYFKCNITLYSVSIKVAYGNKKYL